MKVTTFYSYKGGLGRSLLLSHCAKAMAADGKSIVAIDLDLEAPGLPYKLGFDSRSDMGPGLVGLLQRFLAGKPPPESLRDWVRAVPGHERLSILPAGPLAAATYWNDLAAIEWDHLFRGSDPQGVRFFAWLSESIEREFAPDHLFVDARTGITAMGGAAVSLLADQVVVLVGTSLEGLHGTREILRAITVAPRLAGKSAVRIGVVLARLPGQLIADEVHSIRKSVRDQLQQEAEPLRATVAVDLPMVVRSEPGLERDERSVTGSGRLRVHDDYQTVIDWVGGASASLAAHGSYLSSDASLDVLLELIRIQRELAERDPFAMLPELVRGLSNLSIRLSEAGRRDEALRAVEEAVLIVRRLAVQRPDDMDPFLAWALNRLGNRFFELGRREDARIAAHEAIEVYRRLVEKCPGVFESGLAEALNCLAGALRELGRKEDALAAAKEALVIRRQLAAQRPDVFESDLAMSLNNLGIGLGELGLKEDALLASQEANAILRRLVVKRPDAFEPYLAMSLDNISIRLSELGHGEQAHFAAREAVEIYRRLAAQRPGAFTQQLERSLEALGKF